MSSSGTGTYLVDTCFWVQLIRSGEAFKIIRNHVSDVGRLHTRWSAWPLSIQSLQVNNNYRQENATKTMSWWLLLAAASSPLTDWHQRSYWTGWGGIAPTVCRYNNPEQSSVNAASTCADSKRDIAKDIPGFCSNLCLCSPSPANMNLQLSRKAATLLPSSRMGLITCRSTH